MEKEKHELTEAEKNLIADIDRDIFSLEQQKLGILRLALKSRGLKGNWALDNGVLVEQGKDI